MGLLQILGLKKKQQNSDEKRLAEGIKLIESRTAKLVELTTAFITKQDAAPPKHPVAVAKEFAKETNSKSKRGKDKAPRRKAHFTLLTATQDLVDWFDRRNNKYLTKDQIMTMKTSPLRGIPRSSFYRVIQLGDFETDTSVKPHRFRLKQRSAREIPDAPALYGASLSTISQQLRGTKTPITLHRADCRWHKRKGGKWLYATSLTELTEKIQKLFTQYSKGRTPKVNRCSTCDKAGRLPVSR